MRGSGEPIFCTLAVMVTVSNQASGINVTSAMAGDVRMPANRRLSCILRMTVVARQRAMAARSWLAMPKSGQSELMPPSGSRTP